MRAIVAGEARHGKSTLEIVSYTTFGSLVKRGYVTIDKRSNLTFTDAGYKAFETYNAMDMPQHAHPGEVTDYVAMMRGRSNARKEKAAETKAVVA